MNKYTKYVSLEHLNNGEPTLVADVTGYTVTVDYGEEFINGQFIKIRDTKHYLMGEAVDRLHELEEKDTPKKKKIYAPLGLELCPTCGKDTYREFFKYCPYCGQRIEGEEE